MFSIFNLLFLGFQLFNPSIKLSSGKDLSLVGSGPPVIFSSGLFNTMPRFLYNDLVNKLKNNVTIVSINDFTPLTKNDINDIANGLNVNYVSYISHSSFNPDVLDSDKINRAILVDPICLPQVNVETLRSIDIDRVNINVKFPVLIFKSEKLYKGLKTLPDWQDPNINGEVYSEIVENVGHPDLLDDTWADVARSLGFWETAEGDKVDFKEWEYVKKSNIREIRKNFREYVAEKSLDFINKEDKDIVVPEVIESLEEINVKNLENQ